MKLYLIVVYKTLVSRVISIRRPTEGKAMLIFIRVLIDV